jgi:hypothetical protein
MATNSCPSVSTVLETLLVPGRSNWLIPSMRTSWIPFSNCGLRSRLCVPPIYPWVLVGIDAAMDRQDKSRPRLRSAPR